MRFVLATLFCAPLLLQPAAAPAQKQKKAAAEKKPAAKAPLPFKTMGENISYGIGLDFGRRVYGALMQSLGRGPVSVDRKKLASALGLSPEFAKNFKKLGLEIDEKRLKEGFEHSLSGAKPRLDETQLGDVFKSAKTQIAANRKKLAEARKKLGEKNRKEGKAFLEANKKKAGVKTTKSGLQYTVLKEGKGKSPKVTDIVVAHYHGMLLDGTVFDSTRKSKVPLRRQVGGLIQGWQEALLMMKKGAKWKLFIPAELAYRERGAGDDIGPNAVLIFELELIDIKDAPKFDPRRFKP
jgi:FKBP-type peptidyl-prolyl cis-trans isomerase FklB